MKIAFIIDSLFNSRGMERVLSTCSNMLCNSYDISIITAFNDNKPDFFRLESSIIRKDLGINHRRCFLTLFNNILVKRDYKKALQEYLIKKPQDIVISLGGMDMYFINFLKDRSKKVLWFHFAFNTASVFINEKYNSVMAYFLCKWHSYRMVCCAKNFCKVVLISKADFNTWKHYCNNVTYIYNPITITPKETSPLKEKRAIAVGVLGIQKGFDYLIDSWKIVAQRHPDWKLDIFGAGPDKDKLQNQITRLQLSNTVILRGRSSFIEDEYINHSFFILSSRTEGFGLVLVEAAACGLPLISFDCPQGPSEIISNGENGFLVNEIGDIDSLSDRISMLIENKELRETMGKKAAEYSKKISRDTIKEEWFQLINSLVSL
jgi:glycosyltransferase, group 1 family